MGVPFDIASIRLFIRLLLGLILLTVAVSKLAYPRRFRKGIQDYQIIPSILESKIAISTVLTFFIPLSELVAGIGLISGFLLVPAVVLTLSLLSLFSGAILVNLMRGRHDLSCHCAGALGDHRISWWLVGRNLLLIIGPIVLLLTPPDIFTLDVLVRSPSALTATMWISIVLPVVLLVVGVLIMLVLINAARSVLRTF